MAAPADVVDAPSTWWQSVNRSLGSLTLRWLVLVVASLVAFRSSIASILNSVSQDLELSYVPVVVIYAIFAAAATVRAGRPRIEIHDRETDVIVGGITLVLAVVATSLLAPTLSTGYRMWRVDLLMMWIFIGSAGVLLFGLRRVFQYRWAWATLGLIWPLPSRLVRYVLGDGSLRWGAGVQLLVIILLLIGGRRPGERRWFVAPVLGAAAGAPFILLNSDRVSFLVVVPALVAMTVGGSMWVWGCRDQRPYGIAAPAVAAPRFGALMIMVVAGIATVVIPPLPPLQEPAALPATGPHRQPGSLIPAGWRQIDRQDFPDQSTYFGVNASWVRYKVQALGPRTGPEAVDTEGRHREMVIDVLTTEKPHSFDLFPIGTTYPISRLELSPATRVDLGDGVTGQLYAAVDPQKLLAWSMLTFTISLPADRAVTHPDPDGPAVLAQRITLLLVDDHRPGAEFPKPEHALLDSFRAVLTSVLRGQAQVQVPQIKNADLLETAGRQELAQRAAGAR